MKNRKWLLIVSLVMALTMSLGSTLAYLTDRDSEVNIFSVGNVDIDLTEDFEQGAELLPGVDIEKVPTIINEGENDAWVWMTWSIPASLDQLIQGTQEGSSDNVIHWNPLGATADGYVTETRVNNAIEKGYLPEGTTAEDIIANKTTWNVFNSLGEGENCYQQEIDGELFNTYVLLYNKALTPGEETLPSIYNVYLDARVDIDPDGNWYIVDQGEVTDLGWNSDENGAPKIYVAAYAMQAEGFESVEEAYAAYGEQWGTNDNVKYTEPVTVTSSEELAAAITEATEAGVPAMIMLEDGEYATNFSLPGGSDVTIIGNEDTVLSGQIASTSSTAGTLTLKGVTYKVDNTIEDSTGISQTSKSAIALWGNQTVVCEDVTFEMSLADSTAITTWWDTNEGTTVIVKDCTFNCNGQRPIRATGNVTVDNTEFNDPYRYAVQLTAKSSTATEMDKAIVNFTNNAINDGENGKAYVYGIQLEGETYGCHDLVINGSGNTISGGDSNNAMYYCECGKVDHATVEFNTEVEPVHAN